MTDQNICKKHPDIKCLNCPDCEKDIAYMLWSKLGND